MRPRGVRRRGPGSLSTDIAPCAEGKPLVIPKNTPEATSGLLTLREAAAFLRAPVATLRYWRHLGIGPDGFRLGRRVMYRRDDLDRWVTEQREAQCPRR
jgi:hypothetical protein